MSLLEDIVRQKKEISDIDKSGILLPNNLKLLDFVIHSPNYEINELILKKIYYHLSKNRLDNFYSKDKLFEIMSKFSNYDVKNLTNKYSYSNSSQTIDELMIPALYDIVFLLEDTLNMTPEYIKKSALLIMNIMMTTKLYDQSCGVYIRTLNSDEQADNLILESDVYNFLNQLKAKSHLESLGEMMYDKVFECVVKPTLSELDKPVVLIVLSNTVPTTHNEVLESLERCRTESQNKMSITFVNIIKSNELNEYYDLVNKDDNQDKFNVKLIKNFKNISELF